MADDALEMRFAGIGQHHPMGKVEHFVERREDALERVFPGVHPKQGFEP